MVSPETLYTEIRDEMSRVLVGNEDVVESLVIALLARGNVLLEGVPGVAKTTIANGFARTADLEYNRLQMTPDLLPTNITGSHIYREQTGEFELNLGPIFTNVFLADEINRGAPKTQSALLEAMQERQVTIDGESISLPEPFMLIATQNPIEAAGVFRLPEAQRDRFIMKLTVDLLDMEDEWELIERFDSDSTLSSDSIEPVVTMSDVLDARKIVSQVYVDKKVKQYILDIVHETRVSADITYGSSSRATIALLNASKGRAAVQGRDYVIPDDVKRIATDVLAHRFVLSTDADLGGRTAADVLADLLESIEPLGQELEEPMGPHVEDDIGSAFDSADTADTADTADGDVDE